MVNKPIQSSQLERLHLQLLGNPSSTALLVTNPFNIAYLTGFRGISPQEREVVVLVAPPKARLFVPRMYEAAAGRLEHVQDGSLTVCINSEREGLLTMFADHVSKDTTVLFEAENLTVAEHATIKRHTKAPLRTAGRVVEKLRLRKTNTELSTIRRAVEITDQTFAQLVAYLKDTDYQQLTELDVAEKIWQIARLLGGEALSFPPVVAVGAASAEPHYATGQQKLSKGKALLLDFGISYGGYHGDLTRCVYLGVASNEYKQRYAHVLEANRRGLAACRPGAKGSEVHASAADFFTKHNVGDRFLHSIGHGIGVEVHEEPRLSVKQTTKLEPGMVVTIEPGLYFTGEYGIRIEDYAVITGDGTEVFSASPKELIEI